MVCVSFGGEINCLDKMHVGNADGLRESSVLTDAIEEILMGDTCCKSVFGVVIRKRNYINALRPNQIILFKILHTDISFNHWHTVTLIQ